MSAREKILTLPFVREMDPALNNGLHLDLWTAVPTGDWSRDNAIGRDYALQTLAVVRETGALNLVGEITRAARAKHLQVSGLTVGYCQVFAELAFK